MLHCVPILNEQAPFDPSQVEARSGRQPSHETFAEFQETDAVFPSRLGREPRKGVVVEAGGEDRFNESARHAKPLGRGSIDLAIQADNPAESADRIAFIGQLKRLGQV